MHSGSFRRDGGEGFPDRTFIHWYMRNLPRERERLREQRRRDGVFHPRATTMGVPLLRGADPRIVNEIRRDRFRDELVLPLWALNAPYRYARAEALRRSRAVRRIQRAWRGYRS